MAACNDPKWSAISDAASKTGVPLTIGAIGESSHSIALRAPASIRRVNGERRVYLWRTVRVPAFTRNIESGLKLYPLSSSSESWFDQESTFAVKCRFQSCSLIITATA